MLCCGLLPVFTFSADMLFDFDEDIVKRFTNELCPNLAYELHKLTGWTIAMVSSSPKGSIDYMAHVFVINSDGNAVDIVGLRSIEDLKDEWYFAYYFHRFWDLKEFEREMIGWDLSVRFDKDRVAKQYAKQIVELLR